MMNNETLTETEQELGLSARAYFEGRLLFSKGSPQSDCINPGEGRLTKKLNSIRLSAWRHASEEKQNKDHS